MILMGKTLEELVQETLVELEGMGITESDPGGTARLITYIINKRINGYYKALDLNLAQAFVSQATGVFLDKIGLLLDAKRRPEEIGDDEAYRFRITKQIQVVAAANEIAVRLAALSVAGVQDVKMKRWTHGTGSFSVYVISDNPITPDEILDEVQKKIDETESYGVKGVVFRPSIIPIEMRVKLVFNKTVIDLDRKLMISKAEEEIKKYVNSRNVGDPIDIDGIKKIIRGVGDGIEEIIIYHFQINNRPALVVNQTCAWNERFIESSKPNAIQVM